MCHMWWTLTLTYILRSFGLDLENRVLSVASTVLDGFFPYLVQMITSMRRCVACDDLWPWPISSRSFDLDFENHVCSVTFSVLDRLFFLLGIQYDSIMWVIMRRRGVSSERRRSSWTCDGKCQLGKFVSHASLYNTKGRHPVGRIECAWDPIWYINMGNHAVAGGILRTQAF